MGPGARRMGPGGPWEHFYLATSPFGGIFGPGDFWSRGGAREGPGALNSGCPFTGPCGELIFWIGGRARGLKFRLSPGGPLRGNSFFGSEVEDQGPKSRTTGDFLRWEVALGPSWLHPGRLVI